MTTAPRQESMAIVASKNAIDEHVHFDVHHIAEAIGKAQGVTFSKQVSFGI